jgi:fatty acid desaturase
MASPALAAPIRSARGLPTAVVPYLALLVAMTLTLRVSLLLSLALVLPTSAFLFRTLIVLHDCTR